MNVVLCFFEDISSGAKSLFITLIMLIVILPIAAWVLKRMEKKGLL
jgi:flagellar biogenesis protein FliO